MTFKETIKCELKSWKTFELVVMISIFLFIIINAIIMKDHVVAVISAISGISYSALAGKGKFYCYYCGLIGIFCYSWLSFENALWGNMVLYLCYYFPMQVIGIFEWKKNQKSDAKEIIKKSLTLSQRIKMFALAFVACAVTILTIKYFHGSRPFFDGITTVLSVFGMYFTVKRYLEQWVMWIVVNALSAIMWAILVFNGAKTYATLIMWIVYLILSIYFYVNWRKELKAQEVTSD